MRLLRPLLLSVAVLAACAGAQTNVGGDPKFGKAAEDDFNAAEAEFRAHNYLEATKYYEHVRNKYPFSKYAATAELRLADAKFEQDRFTEAAEAYQQFARLHPTHDQADYAAYRVALSHWRDGPGDFILFPPSYEKEQGQVKEAAKSFEAFLKQYPSSKYRPDAEKLLAEARKRLAEHEWYVAQFYAKRGHWAGAAARFEALVREYPGSPRESAALLEMAQAYLKMDERYRAQQALQQLIVKHPQDPHRADAEKLLASLR
jgi:outer membrane protein assembly factor BamD